MLTFEKILCPTDFSEPSYEALTIADEMARHFSGELLLVHAVPPVPSYPAPVVAPGAAAVPPQFDIPTYTREMEESAKKSLDEVIDKRISKETAVRPLVSRGDPADVLTRLVPEENIDLIVIATHGRTGWRRFVFGSVAEKVVRLATCPVLTIRGEDQDS
jgi:nucleotide-binding universal stress UspA family protein